MYGFARNICTFILNIFSRWEIIGRDKIPLEGPVIIVCNHVSYWDPVILGCAMTRKVRFMAKADLFNIPIFNKLLISLGAFPIKRGQSDRTALRTAIKILKDNQVIGLFPEGTRSKTGMLLPFKSGANMIAYKTKCPILPVAVINSRNALMGWRKPVKIVFGTPMTISYGEKRPSSTELATWNDKIKQAVQDLLDEYKL